MTVLTDAQYCEIRFVRPEQLRVSITLSGSINCLAAEPMEFAQRHFIDETIDEKTAEGLWRAVVHAEVFIKVEADDARPVDAEHLDQCSQKFILRWSGRKNSDRATLLFN